MKYGTLGVRERRIIEKEGMQMELGMLLQVVSCVTALCVAYAGYRARDNARAATLARIQLEVGHLSTQLAWVEQSVETIRNRLDRRVDDERSRSA